MAGLRPVGGQVTAALLLAALVLAGCAGLPSRDRSDGLVSEALAWATTDGMLSVHSLRPGPAERAQPDGLVVMQHGFMRQCRHLDGLRTALARQSWWVLCLDLPAAAGDPALADNLAVALRDGSITPAGVVMPPRIVVGGFSAGSVFAVRLGAALARLAPERLAGALLLDPVDARGFEAALRIVDGGGRRPWLAILANPGPCNAQLSAQAPLDRVRADALPDAAAAGVVVQLTRGSTHVDAEGEDSSDLAIAACGQGPPVPANVAALRGLVAAWLARWGDPPLPAAFGDALEPLLREGAARRLDGGATTAPSSPRRPGSPLP